MKPFNKNSSKWVMYSSMGLELGLSVIVGFLIGSGLDKWLETGPYLLIIFGIAGIIAGYRSIFRLVKKIQNDSKNTTIIRAGNMSLGVNILTGISAKVAEALDSDFDIEIVEMHHDKKVDAPSGTALMLGDSIAKTKGNTLDNLILSFL